MEERVAEALLRGDGETQILAARRLCRLTSSLRHNLAHRGVIAPLISMLRSRDFDTIEAALFALLSLSSGSERNKIRIAESGALPVLLKLLRCESDSIFDLVVASLLILSSCTANKLEIADTGAIQLLIEILNTQSITLSVQAKQDIIATLHNLSASHQIIPSLVLSGAIPSLIQLFYNSDKSSELAEKAMALLERIVSSSEIALEETAATTGSVQALVEALEEGSPLCKEYAVGVLVLICNSCRERYRGMILREGVMPGLLQLGLDGTWRAREMARALLLLLRDCSGGGSRTKQRKNALLEEAMERIDAEERMGAALRLVEETIAKAQPEAPKGNCPARLKNSVPWQTYIAQIQCRIIGSWGQISNPIPKSSGEASSSLSEYL
ncbi:Ubiquitin--protein ligase [Bertholletia excelsa]